MVGGFNDRTASNNMTMSPERVQENALEQRVCQLTSGQRAFLAEQLDARAERGEESLSRNILVAWYVTHEREMCEDRMREYAVEHLPSEIVPHRFIRLNAISRNGNGKVDRRELSSTLYQRPVTAAATSAACGSWLETRLLAIWKSVLGTSEISVRDNFYHIGGDSLATIHLMACCSDAGIQVTPGILSDHPTIAALAEFLSTAQMEGAGREVASSALDAVTTAESVEQESLAVTGDVNQRAANPKGVVLLSGYVDKPPLFLIPPGGVDITQLRDLVEATRAYTCYAPVTTDRGAMATRTVAEMAVEFLRQIREIQPAGPYRFAGICEGAYIAWEISRLLSDAGEEVSFLGIIDTPNPRSLRSKSLASRIRSRIKTLDASSIGVVGQVFRRLGSYVRRRTRQAVTKEVHLTRAGNRLAWLFRAEPWDGRATLFRTVVPPEKTDFTTDETYGWSGLARDGLEVFPIPCSREEMMMFPFAGLLARRIEMAIRLREGELGKSIEGLGRRSC
jgi:thioesterase domain-containing protein/aryl carrier-like protein